jgi:protein TonB
LKEVLPLPTEGHLPVMDRDNAVRTGAARVRHTYHRRDDWQIAAGWIVAALLHGVLLAALIMGQPAPLPAASARASVSLLLQPAGEALRSAVAPRPAAIPAQLPPASKPAIAATTSSVIPKARALRRASISKPRPRAIAASPAAPPLEAGGTQPAISAPGSQNFVAAEPLFGAFNQPPEYPQTAVEHGEQGRVLLSIHVLPDGLTDFVAVTQSSGFRVLDQAAQDAVLKWRFRPATMAGRPVVMVLTFWFNFDLQTQNVQPAAQ